MPSFPAATPAPRHETRRLWLAAAALFCVTFVVYAPVWRAALIWDDEAHVTGPALRSLHGLWRIWFEPGATQQYYPLLHSTFWLEHRLWGDAALGYHLANFALHAGVALLFFLLLRRLAVPGAFLAALIFSLHPVHVESVAWISEQKNTLSTLLYLGAAFVYLRFESTRARAAYLAASGLFLAARFTKTVTATLPAALLVIGWWQRGHLSWRRDVLPLAPWLVVGAGAGLFTAWIERTFIGAEGAAYDLTALQRGLLAGRALWFYLGKLCWPADLTFIYPRWTIEATSPWQWLPLLGVLALGTALWLGRHRSRTPLAALLLFAGSLFPVLGFFNIYPFVYSFVADHFQYLASLGVIAFAAGALSHLGRAGCTLGAASALVLATLTWRHSRIFQNNETLFRATVARHPACWMAHNNLGKELLRDPSRLGEALACFERALAVHPEYFEARNNLGLALAQAGRPRDALPHLAAALRLKPDSFQALNNLGIALAGSGQAEAAVAVFARAARLNPALPNLEENWAKALVMLGRTREADAHLARAAELRARAVGRP